MKKYVCSICGYVYDETAGIPQEGISPGTKWEDVPTNWICPLCGATKADFEEQKTSNQPIAHTASGGQNNSNEMRGLSFAELSALCSNLSKGCEKQYQAEAAELFGQLSQYYKSKVTPVDEKKIEDLNSLIQQDLSSGYVQANIVATAQSDRGALRALVWGEKVTKILTSLLNRYEKHQDALLENTKIYVCDICGFVYLGEKAPDICPVCKVPNMKLTEVQRG